MTPAETLEPALRAARPEVRETLDRALAGTELSWQDGARLLAVTGDELAALRATADWLRRQQAGDDVAYVVNRNINFTNACTKACRFCAFSRGHRSEQAYFLDEAEVVRRALQARSLNATEVCIQAGLAPGMDPWLYVKLCRAIKRAAPELHIHAFSPEEVKYGATLAGVTFREYLVALKEEGLGSLPGTSAEILDDELRARLAPGRITTGEWLEVVTSAHALAIPTTSTMMYGHIETREQRAQHLALLRSVQKDTGGFTEFVPLSFVAEEAPMVRKGLVPGLHHGPSRDEVVRTYAVARLMLGATFRNVQAAWVKEGLALAAEVLAAGANDLGGTLMNESISTSAGAAHGQMMKPSMLREAIRKADRTPVQRDTLYRPLQRFGAAGEDQEELDEPLEEINDPEAVFGSFRSMTEDARFRLHVLPRR